ncbi:methanogenesis marker 16 metalloprotein [Methanobrevibacter filiformis]|uniref:methanogenesis marker 16 metalloprotein n=1 Tax=Methanobrevibacter filiformis TaxID=55758 RepID=UPI00082F4138|nr:methanogenesis marker 16 metalloprotein [Methanobrevibacter filiformis]
MQERTLDEIKEKINNGEANVFTIQEFKKAISDGEELSFDDVDVVTTGTCGIMSGTAAILHIGITGPGEFQKAKNVFLNGVPAFPGPCPNEQLGSVDVIVYGTEHSVKDHGYGGGFLLKDLLNGEKVDVEVESIEGKKFETQITIDDVPRGQIIGVRMTFKNYTAFVNPTGDKVNSIFNAIPMEGVLNQLSFSGCGEYNPLQNDPNKDIIGEGTKILFNGSKGVVLGPGTRSSDVKPNLMLTADLLDMEADYIGGFKTGAGPEIYDTVAIPIPVLNEEVFNKLLLLDPDVKLPVADIHGRHLPLTEINYENVWKDTDERPVFIKENFNLEENKVVQESCPTNAINDNGTINLDNCFGCGLCTVLTTNNTYEMKLGVVDLEIENKKHSIPVTCRQSDRQRAKKITTKLKQLILNKEFEL